MIRPTMAVAAVGSARPDVAEFARDARIMRAMALLVDLLCVGAVTFVVNSVYGVTQPASGGVTVGGGAFSTTVAWPWLTLVGVLYFAIPEAMFGATPGKLWARLRVVRLDGRPLSVGSVIGRNLLKPIDFLPLLYLLGGLLVMFTRGSQRIGDLAAGTTVVYRHRALDPGATRRAGPAAKRVAGGLLVFTFLITLLFDYFGRPPLVIQGLFNVHEPPFGDSLAYSVGQPQWSLGQVAYPITVTEQIGGPTGQLRNCPGTITLDWQWLGGWNTSSSGFTCG